MQAEICSWIKLYSMLRYGLQHHITLILEILWVPTTHNDAHPLGNHALDGAVRVVWLFVNVITDKRTHQ